MSNIRNFIQMTDRIGTSGQPTREQFRQIAAAQYKTVINLAMPDSTHAIPDEHAAVEEAGMSYVHIPVPFDNPSADHLKLFVRTMRALEDERVWVHCAVNFRVSAFMYQYLRLEKGYDEAAAKNEILKRWEPEMDAPWRKFMQITAADIA